MNKLKYVFNCDSGAFVLFPDFVPHDTLSGKWTNAGFVDIIQDGVDSYGETKYKAVCNGESISLKLKADPDGIDSRTITSYINRRS